MKTFFQIPFIFLLVAGCLSDPAFDESFELDDVDFASHEFDALPDYKDRDRWDAKANELSLRALFILRDEWDSRMSAEERQAEEKALDLYEAVLFREHHETQKVHVREFFHRTTGRDPSDYETLGGDSKGHFIQSFRTSPEYWTMVEEDVHTLCTDFEKDEDDDCESCEQDREAAFLKLTQALVFRSIAAGTRNARGRAASVFVGALQRRTGEKLGLVDLNRTYNVPVDDEVRDACERARAVRR